MGRHGNIILKDGVRKMCIPLENSAYRQTSNIRCTLAVNNLIDHLDLVGASPVGAAPTTSSF